MKKLLRLWALSACILLVSSQIQAQLLQILPPSEQSRADFNGGFYFKLAPFGVLPFEAGNRNMINRLKEVGINSMYSSQVIYTLGYWRNNWVFELENTVPQFSSDFMVASGQVGIEQIYYSWFNRAIQLGAGYRIGDVYKQRHDIYLKMSMGWHVNTFDMRVINSSTAFDMDNFFAAPGFVGLARFRQSAPHLDLSIEMRSSIKRRMELLESLSIGCRYGLKTTPWEAHMVPTYNPISDRSVLIYMTVAFGMRLNKQR